MKVELLYKSSHTRGWKSIVGISILDVLNAFDYECKRVMHDNTHIDLYEITDFRIHLKRN